VKDWLRHNVRWVAPAAVVLGVFAGWLIFGYFGFQTILFDDEVNEDVPVFASGASQSSVSTSGEAASADTTGTSEAPEDPAPPSEESDTSTEEPATAPTTEPPDDGPEITVQYEGSFQDRSHPAEGTAAVLNDGTDQRFLRFEEFATDNGPDLNVYLATAPADAPASDFGVEGRYIDLGDLKGNTGPQNYEVPPDVDLDEFGTVVIWCVRFGVAFGSAELPTS
jgi:hypothetical protein